MSKIASEYMQYNLLFHVLFNFTKTKKSVNFQKLRLLENRYFTPLHQKYPQLFFKIKSVWRIFSFTYSVNITVM